MANEENLVQIQTRAKRVQREMRSKGGKARAKKLEERKLLKERLLTLLDQSDGEYTKSESICLSLISRALEGDTKAFEVIRDTIGEKPTDKVNIESGDSKLKQIKISFVDKSKPKSLPETDPKIIGEYTQPVEIKDG